MTVKIKKGATLQSVFATNLIRLRQKKHMTQVDLAKKTKISQNHISALETGVRSPSFDALRILAEALDAKASDFLA